MPDTQISEGMVERGARAIAPLAWAALGIGDTLAQANRRKASLRHSRAALEAALSGHVVVPIADLTELVRICNSAEHDAKSAARKLVGHSMQHDVEVLAHTFKLIREKIKDQAAPPVPEDGGIGDG